jgi:glutamate synthase domain-containing protein 2
VCASCKDCAEQHCSACVFTYNDTFKHDHIPEKVCRVSRPLCAITLAFFSVFPAFSSRACPGQPDLRRLQSGHRR